MGTGEPFDNYENLSRFIHLANDHPLYFTTKFAEELSEKEGLTLLKVQHHQAHVAVWGVTCAWAGASIWAAVGLAHVC